MLKGKKLIFSMLFSMLLFVMSTGAFAHSVTVRQKISTSSTYANQQQVGKAYVNGNASVDKGASVTIKLEGTKTGYRFKELQFDTTDVTASGLTFTMPDHDVTVIVVYDRVISSIDIKGFIEPAHKATPVTTGYTLGEDSEKNVTVQSVVWKKESGGSMTTMHPGELFYEGTDYAIFVTFAPKEGYAAFDDNVYASINGASAKRETVDTWSLTVTCTHAHDGKVVPAVPATYTTEGVKKYYACDCGKYFEDEDCKVEIKHLDYWKANSGKVDKLVPVKVGDIVEDQIQHATYRVLSTDENKREVCFLKPGDENSLKPGNYTIPNGFLINGDTYLVTEIAANAFRGNEKVKGVNISKYVRKIGKYAFQNCKNLMTVTGAKGVEQIGARAFKGCVSLKKFTLHKKVNLVGKAVFADCKSMTKLVFKTTNLSKKNTCKGSFKSLSKNIKVTFPAAKKGEYSALKAYWGLKN